jgi:hypothetical protein
VNRRSALGWVAVGCSTLVASCWAFWGAIENFHEGWYFASLWRNLGLMLVQYLAPMLTVMLLALLSLWQRWLGLALHLAAAAGLYGFLRLRTPAGLVLELCIVGLGLLYLLGRPEPRRRAVQLLVGLPLAVGLGSGAYPGWRAITRPDTVDLMLQRIEGNGVALIWAPAGPGWPEGGLTWAEAVRRCAYLDPDGTALLAEPQQAWRLPTVDEAVRSQRYRGRNAGGSWDPAPGKARYRAMPDKEAPLWNPRSPVIYWWTATEVDSARAYRIGYNGQVHPIEKRWGPGYSACRCVRDATR